MVNENDLAQSMADAIVKDVETHRPTVIGQYNNPRGQIPTPIPPAPYMTGSVEQKLQAIEKLISEIRSVSAQIKNQLG